MGQTLKHFAQSHFHIPQNLYNSYSKAIHADHPIIQLFSASGAALCSFLIIQEYAGGGNALAAVVGTSAFIFIGFASVSYSIGAVVINLLAAPLVFVLAIASMSGPTYLLIAAFVIHALATERHASTQNKQDKAPLHCWAIYNLSLALLIV